MRQVVSRPALDLARCHWTHQCGDITVYGTWWLADDAGPRPCLVLMPTRQSAWAGATPYVVHIDQSWIWSEEIGLPERAARNSMEAAQCLGLSVSDPLTVMRVRSIIVDHLPELLVMPPMPPDMREGKAIGEVTIRRDGQIIREQEVTDHG